ncbi:MAG: hypothetical protein Q7T11_04905 [Deltaproteobacteria bacterium]|nr:hypothetical protein [Deltaproteobacteria bacterium]
MRKTFDQEMRGEGFSAKCNPLSKYGIEKFVVSMTARIPPEKKKELESVLRGFIDDLQVPYPIEISWRTGWHSDRRRDIPVDPDEEYFAVSIDTFYRNEFMAGSSDDEPSFNHQPATGSSAGESGGAQVPVLTPQ